MKEYEENKETLGGYLNSSLRKKSKKHDWRRGQGDTKKGKREKERKEVSEKENDRVNMWNIDTQKNIKILMIYTRNWFITEEKMTSRIYWIIMKSQHIALIWRLFNSVIYAHLRTNRNNTDRIRICFTKNSS